MFIELPPYTAAASAFPAAAPEPESQVQHTITLGRYGRAEICRAKAAARRNAGGWLLHLSADEHSGQAFTYTADPVTIASR